MDYGIDAWPDDLDEDHCACQKSMRTVSLPRPTYPTGVGEGAHAELA